MSWDIFVQDIPENVQSVSDIPDNFQPSPLGVRSNFIKKICEFVPTADFSDPSWGVFETLGISVEFNMGNTECLNSFALHVRGSDDAAAFVSDLLDYLGLRAFDGNTDGGIFISGKVAKESFENWRAYRDEILS